MLFMFGHTCRYRNKGEVSFIVSYQYALGRICALCPSANEASLVSALSKTGEEQAAFLWSQLGTYIAMDAYYRSFTFKYVNWCKQIETSCACILVLNL